MTLHLLTVELNWEPVSGSTGYDILLDGAKVASAGAAATQTKVTVPEGSHALSIKAQPSGFEQKATNVWTSEVAPPPPPPPTTDKFLSDLAWVGTPTNGWGPVEKDKSNGEKAAGDGKPLTIGGKVYPKGLGCHAPAEIKYALAGGYTRFKAEVGVDDEVGANGSVIFQVFADGTKKYDSGVVKGPDAAKVVDVDITGCQELRLVVTNGGDNASFDHADWADARVTVGAVVPPPPPPPPPPPGTTPLYGMNLGKWFDSTHNPSLPQRLGAKIGRIEYNISTAPSALDTPFAAFRGVGVEVIYQCGFGGSNMPTSAECQNLGAVAQRHGPNGTKSIKLIEFGNETSYSYQWPGGANFFTLGQQYARKAKEAAIALQGTGVGLLVQVDDALEGPAWVDGMFDAVPDLTSYVTGWVVHPYGPSWGPQRIDRAIANLARHGDTSKPFYFTEWGVASDNGNNLNDNYGWPTNMTYQQAADALATSEAMWIQKCGARWVFTSIYGSNDSSPPGASNQREEYFGIVQVDGTTSKGAYTTAVKARFAQ